MNILRVKVSTLPQMGGGGNAYLLGYTFSRFLIC